MDSNQTECQTKETSFSPVLKRHGPTIKGLNDRIST